MVKFSMTLTLLTTNALPETTLLHEPTNVIFPEVAPTGTVAVMSDVFTIVNAALTPLNKTEVTEFISLPIKLTVVPIFPAAGLKEENETRGVTVTANAFDNEVQTLFTPGK